MSSALAHFYGRWAVFSEYVVLNRSGECTLWWLCESLICVSARKVCVSQIGGVLLMLNIGGDWAGEMAHNHL
ncbi:hypothetical protein ACRRTK_020530 [Alexandromys fortis]